MEQLGDNQVRIEKKNYRSPIKRRQTMIERQLTRKVSVGHLYKDLRKKAKEDPDPKK